MKETKGVVMVPSGILVSITTREARGGLLVTFGTLLHLYGTIVFWLYVEQLTLVELFYHINVFIVVSVSISFFSGNRRGFLYITNASIGV